MASYHDYIPGQDAAFDAFFHTLRTYVTQKCQGASPAWTHIPAGKVIELVNGYAAWNDAWTATQSPHTPVQTREKNRVRDREERNVRKFIQRYIYVDDPVTDLDRDNMNVPNRDQTRTPHWDTPEHVDMTHRPHADLELLFEFRVEETGERAIPSGYNGVVLYTRPLEDGEPVPDRMAILESRLVSHAYHIERFDSRLKGGRVAVTAAWENGRGVEGQRCEVVVVTVP